MKVHNHAVWGFLLILLVLTLPLEVRPVPHVVFNEAEMAGDNTVLCEGCNPLIFGQPININQASVEHLIALPFIGAKRAQDIVAMRESQGPFQSILDLDAVRGIGPKTIDRIWPYVVIE